MRHCADSPNVDAGRAIVFAVADESFGMEREGWPDCRGTPSSLLALTGMPYRPPAEASCSIHPLYVRSSSCKCHMAQNLSCVL